MPAQYMFRLQWVSWNSGRMSDFDLPKTLGYYQTEMSAERAITAHITKIKFKTDKDNPTDHTTTDDYRITRYLLLP